MRPTYIQEVKHINEAIMFFACLGYQVDATFHSKHNSMEVSIFFNDIDLKDDIKRNLQRYEDENDEIVFRTHSYGNNSEFYTIRLIKFAS